MLNVVSAFKHTENVAEACWHRLYLVIWQWTISMPGLDWKVFKHANGLRDAQQNHETFLRMTTAQSDGHAEGPRVWYQIEDADADHFDVVLYASSGNPPDCPVQKCHPFSSEAWNLILMEGVCLIEGDKKWRRMMVYVLGNLLHLGHLGTLGPVQYVPRTPMSKGKVGKACLTWEFWA